MTMTSQLERSASEIQGIASSAIVAFLEAAEQQIDALHSFMLLRHGKVVAEGWWTPYSAQAPHILYSLSKSFTSTAIGLAVEEGRLSIDDLVLSFFPESAPAQASENLKAMRVRHLLSMSTGNALDTTGCLQNAPDGDWVKAFLACPVEYEPGTHFVYNSGATYMLSAIIHKITGGRLLDYLQSRLLAPLGIEGATWETDPRGIDVGGWGMSIKTEDIARFGQLYLQKGVWQGEQLVPEVWVESATTSQISNAGTSANADWQQGYGYQFWRCRHDAYRGDGAFGQFCVVFPEQDAVLAITSGVENMQAVLDLIWEHLLPAMQPGRAPANSAAQMALARKLGGLALPTVKGQRSSPLAGEVSGKTYRFEPNERHVQALTFSFEGNNTAFTVEDEHGEHRIACGSGAWVSSTTSFIYNVPYPIAASGAWTDEQTYVVRVYFTETPFSYTVTSRFAGDELLLTLNPHVSFGPTEFPQLVGKVAE